MRLVPCLAALCLASTAAPAPAQAPEALTLNYRCDDGAHLPVAYVNAPEGASYAVLVHDAKLDVLKAGPTGSGVRYVSIDGSSLVWHVKGPEGFLARDDGDETMILTGCKQL
jgi:membrane-bound inhibitor of C-type lysozyme